MPTGEAAPDLLIVLAAGYASVLSPKFAILHGGRRGEQDTENKELVSRFRPLHVATNFGIGTLAGRRG